MRGRRRRRAPARGAVADRVGGHARRFAVTGREHRLRTGARAGAGDPAANRRPGATAGHDATGAEVQRLEVPVTWHEHEFPAMGTIVRVVVHGGSDGLVEWAEREVRRLESRWSRFLAESDVVRMNAAAGGAPCPVASETIDLVDARAVELWNLTDGRFDPTILRALEACGYDESFERVRDRAPDGSRRELVTAPPGLDAIRVVVRQPRARSERAPGCSGVTVDAVARTRSSCRAGVAIDLGGVGKGYAGDLVARGLVAARRARRVHRPGR